MNINNYENNNQEIILQNYFQQIHDNLDKIEEKFFFSRHDIKENVLNNLYKILSKIDILQEKWIN